MNLGVMDGLRLLRNGFFPRVADFDGTLPNFDSRALAGAEILPDRIALLRRMVSQGVVAELGVDKGDFSAHILSVSQPNKLFLVDLWGSRRYSTDKRDLVLNKFSREIDRGKVEVRQERSTAFAHSISESSLDWVYVDTDHSFQTTKSELDTLEDKVRLGGFILGDDFTWGNIVTGYRYGVVQAVAQFLHKSTYKLRYLTLELDRNWSFGLERIK